MDKAFSGTFHISDSGPLTSWAAFAREIFTVFEDVLPHKVTVKEVPSSTFSSPANRPASSVLDLTKTEEILEHSLPDWREGVKVAKRERQNHMQDISHEYPVKDPSAYGVVGFDENKQVISLKEKPDNPASDFAVTGLYCYGSYAPEYARRIKPSKRGELEITDLNRIYLEAGNLHVELLGGGTMWLDTGTHRSLLQAAQFVSVIEERQGRRICCPEIIAFNQGWIDVKQLAALAAPLNKSGYGKYLLRVAGNG